MSESPTPSSSGPKPPLESPASSGAPADALLSAATWLERGEKVALATVVETWGSSPCPAGSQLAVSETRSFAGSVSGGCVEGAVVEAAIEVMRTGEPIVLEYGVADERAWEVGLACGGRIRVFVEGVK